MTLWRRGITQKQKRRVWRGVVWCGVVGYPVTRHKDTLREHTGPGASTASTECLEWRFVLRSTPSRNNLPIQKH